MESWINTPLEVIGVAFGCAVALYLLYVLCAAVFVAIRAVLFGLLQLVCGENPLAGTAWFTGPGGKVDPEERKRWIAAGILVAVSILVAVFWRP